LSSSKLQLWWTGQQKYQCGAVYGWLLGWVTICEHAARQKRRSLWLLFRLGDEYLTLIAAGSSSSLPCELIELCCVVLCGNLLPASFRKGLHSTVLEYLLSFLCVCLSVFSSAAGSRRKFSFTNYTLHPNYLTTILVSTRLDLRELGKSLGNSSRPTIECRGAHNSKRTTARTTTTTKPAGHQINQNGPKLRNLRQSPETSVRLRTPKLNPRRGRIRKTCSLPSDG